MTFKEWKQENDIMPWDRATDKWVSLGYEPEEIDEKYYGYQDDYCDYCDEEGIIPYFD